MQSASEVPNGRKIDVYTYSQQKLYSINLDLCKYAMSRDESICIYTNGAFLAAADSKSLPYLTSKMATIWAKSTFLDTWKGVKAKKKSIACLNKLD